MNCLFRSRSRVTVADKADSISQRCDYEICLCIPSSEVNGSRRKDPQIQSFYQFGGYVYYNGERSSWSQQLYPALSGGTKPIGFAQLKEVENLSAEDRKAFVDSDCRREAS